MLALDLVFLIALFTLRNWLPSSGFEVFWFLLQNGYIFRPLLALCGPSVKIFHTVARCCFQPIYHVQFWRNPHITTAPGHFDYIEKLESPVALGCGSFISGLVLIRCLKLLGLRYLEGLVMGWECCCPNRLIRGSHQERTVADGPRSTWQLLLCSALNVLCYLALVQLASCDVPVPSLAYPKSLLSPYHSLGLCMLLSDMHVVMLLSVLTGPRGAGGRGERNWYRCKLPGARPRRCYIRWCLYWY